MREVEVTEEEGGSGTHQDLEQNSEGDWSKRFLKGEKGGEGIEAGTMQGGEGLVYGLMARRVESPS